MTKVGTRCGKFDQELALGRAALQIHGRAGSEHQLKRRQKSELTKRQLLWHCQLGSVPGHTNECFSVLENLLALAKFRDFRGANSN